MMDATGNWNVKAGDPVILVNSDLGQLITKKFKFKDRWVRDFAEGRVAQVKRILTGKICAIGDIKPTNEKICAIGDIKDDHKMWCDKIELVVKVSDLKYAGPDEDELEALLYDV